MSVMNIRTINKSNTGTLLLGLGGLALAASACGINLGEEGSGVAETVTYDFADFDDVEIGGTFDADITVADGPYSVSITVDDNLVDNLDTKIDDGQLEIDWKGGGVSSKINPEVVITMPSLVKLEVGGASQATATGIEADEFRLESSGASQVTIDGEIAKLDVDGSGASDLTVTGTAGNITLDLSGASAIDFTAATVVWADVDISGASQAAFDDVDRIEGDLSGASNLTAPSGTNTDISSSGGSNLNLG